MDCGKLLEQNEKLQEQCRKLTAENARLKAVLKIISDISNKEIVPLTGEDDINFLINIQKVGNKPSPVPSKPSPFGVGKDKEPEEEPTPKEDPVPKKVDPDHVIDSVTDSDSHSESNKDSDIDIIPNEKTIEEKPLEKKHKEKKQDDDAIEEITESEKKEVEKPKVVKEDPVPSITKTRRKRQNVDINFGCPIFSKSDLQETLNSVDDKLLVVVIDRSNSDRKFCNDLAKYVLAHTPSIVLNSLDSYVNEYERRILSFIKEKEDVDEIFDICRFVYLCPYETEPYEIEKITETFNDMIKRADGKVRFMLANLGKLEIDVPGDSKKYEIADKESPVKKFCFVGSGKK